MKKYQPTVWTIIILVCFAVQASAQKNGKRTHRIAGKTPGSAKADMLTLLQGRWSSLEDKKTFFQIEGDRQLDIYGKDILDTATINFYDECPKRTNLQDEKKRSGKYLVVQLKPDDFYCYSVESLTAKQLTLMYLPKGSLLKYKKVPTINLSDYNHLDVDD